MNTCLPALARTITVAIAAMILNSCAIPRVVNEPSEVSYSGLADQLSNDSGSGKTLHVIVTHGMGHDPKDMDTFTDLESRTLELIERTYDVTSEPPSGEEAVTLIDSPDALDALRETKLGKSEPERLESYISNNGGKEKKHLYFTHAYRWKDGNNQLKDIRYHWISYSWYLAWLKSRLQIDDEPFWRESTYLINRMLKKGVMNKGFPDAVNYLSDEHGMVVRGHFIDCFNRISAHMDENDEVVLVSSSLGSKVLLDSLHQATKDRGHEPIRIAERTSHFFMFANQIPLLDLGENKEDTGLQFLIQERARSAPRAGGGKNEIAIVSFGDPSDLLTYYLNAERQKNEFPNLSVKFANVEVRNPGVAIWPILREPSSAHSGHRKNSAVIKRIVLGSDRR